MSPHRSRLPQRRPQRRVGPHHEPPATEPLREHEKDLVQPRLQLHVHRVVQPHQPEKRRVPRLIAALAREEAAPVEEQIDVVAVPERQRRRLRRVGPHHRARQHEIAGLVLAPHVPRDVHQARGVRGHRPPIGQEDRVEIRVRGAADAIRRIRPTDGPIEQRPRWRRHCRRRRERRAGVVAVAEVREVRGAVRRAAHAESARARAVLQPRDHQRRIRSIAEEHARLAAPHFQPHAHPGIGGDVGSGRESLTMIELPPRHAIEHRGVLQRVRIETRAVWPDVEALVRGLRLHAEHDSRVRAPAVHRDVHLDRPVRERHVLQQRRPAKRRSAEVLHDFAVHDPPLRRVEWCLHLCR